jgi:recombination protein RecT
MEQQNLPQTQQRSLSKMPVREFFESAEIQSKFKQLLGKRASAFCTSVLQIVASNHLLTNADPGSIYQAAAVAATLDLPLNNNLGFAYIVPYKTKQKDGSYKTVAQFQMGYKGFIQLAQRSGQFKAITSAPVYEGQLISEDPLEGFVFDFTKKTSDKMIGYAARFKLLNGFEATWYMTVDQLKKHGQKFSKTYKDGLWEKDFDAMASKTVIKLLLSKFAPLSVEMQKAVMSDQAVVQDASADQYTYIDNDEDLPPVDKALERAVLLVNDCKTAKELMKLKETLPEGAMEAYEAKMEEFLND